MKLLSLRLPRLKPFSLKLLSLRLLRLKLPRLKLLHLKENKFQLKDAEKTRRKLEILA